MVPFEYDSLSFIAGSNERQGRVALGADTTRKFFQGSKGSTLHILDDRGQELFSLAQGIVVYQKNHLFVVEIDGIQRFWSPKENSFVGKRYKSIEPSYYPELNGFLLENDGFGFASDNGDELIPCKYQSLKLICGKWIARDIDGLHLISLKGERIDVGSFTQADPLTSITDNELIIKNEGKWGLWDAGNDQWILPLKYDHIYLVSKNLLAVQKGNLYGRFTKEGEVVVPVEYEHISFYEVFSW